MTKNSRTCVDTMCLLNTSRLLIFKVRGPYISVYKVLRGVSGS